MRRPTAMRSPLFPWRLPNFALRAKLVLAVLALVTIALLVIGIFSAFAVRQYFLDSIDAQLNETVRALVDQETPLTDKSDPAARDYVVGWADGDKLVLYAADRDTLPKLPTKEEMLERANDPFTTFSKNGKQRWRMLIRPLNSHQFIIFGQSLAAVDAAVDRLVAAELIVGIGVLAVLATAGIGIVQASLKPLTEFERTAAAIAAGDLTRRVPESDPGTEVGRLANALNAMLAQIEGAFAARAASEERMREFVADASHELRTPLTTIRGFAELYRQGAMRTPEETQALLRRIENEASRMGLLVEDLLLLARLDQRRPITLAPVELRVLASDAVAAARAVAPDREITLDDVAGAVLVIGDEPRLCQVVGNLLTNALTHTPAGTPIAVRVRAGERYAVLEVSDSGPGLTPEQQQRVFERFYRVDKARTRRAAGNSEAVAPHSGSGLGLAIVAALVAAHRGTVSVASQPGKGATFVVRLPLAQQEPVGPPGPPSAGTRPSAGPPVSTGQTMPLSGALAPGKQPVLPGAAARSVGEPKGPLNSP